MLHPISLSVSPAFLGQGLLPIPLYLHVFLVWSHTLEQYLDVVRDRSLIMGRGCVAGEFKIEKIAGMNIFSRPLKTGSILSCGLSKGWKLFVPTPPSA